MADEARVCLNPMPTIPEDGPAPGHKYKKLATDDYREPVSVLCALNVACILFMTIVLIAIVALLVIVNCDPCIVSICNDFNVTKLRQ
jgi:hypothetical protein